MGKIHTPHRSIIQGLKWGKFTLHTDHQTRTEKYRPWSRVNCHRIHTKKRQSYHKTTDEHPFNCSTDSGTFILNGQGMGYPPKHFIDSDSDGDIPPHIPDIEDYCRTCLSHRVRFTCKPMSNWSADLIDITQPDCPNTDNNATKMTGMMDKITP